MTKEICFTFKNEYIHVHILDYNIQSNLIIKNEYMHVHVLDYNIQSNLTIKHFTIMYKFHGLIELTYFLTSLILISCV